MTDKEKERLKDFDDTPCTWCVLKPGNKLEWFDREIYGPLCEAIGHPTDYERPILSEWNECSILRSVLKKTAVTREWFYKWSDVSWDDPDLMTSMRDMLKDLGITVKEDK